MRNVLLLITVSGVISPVSMPSSTRQYLGEAYLQLRQPDKARDQLAQIGARCGTGCEDYQLLAKAITAAQG